LTVCENRVLRRIFGLKWKEVVGDWRRIRNEELQNSYISDDQFEEDEMGGAYRTHGRAKKWIQYFGLKA
jgi:hypothetical protein